ncbi:unnamed protein product [Prunus brigantina]
MDNLRFEESKLKALVTIEEYNHALSKGTKNGGVAAIFDEIPYLKLFIAKNCSKYTMVGPTYKTDGFGFAFPRGSPLVSYMSRAILNVTQDKSKMDSIEEKYFGNNQTICDDQSAKNFFRRSKPSCVPLRGTLHHRRCSLHVFTFDVHVPFPLLTMAYFEDHDSF